jgi:hypothetical protein
MVCEAKSRKHRTPALVPFAGACAGSEVFFDQHFLGYGIEAQEKATLGHACHNMHDGNFEGIKDFCPSESNNEVTRHR